MWWKLVHMIFTGNKEGFHEWFFFWPALQGWMYRGFDVLIIELFEAAALYSFLEGSTISTKQYAVFRYKRTQAISSYYKGKLPGAQQTLQEHQWSALSHRGLPTLLSAASECRYRICKSAYLLTVTLPNQIPPCPVPLTKEFLLCLFIGRIFWQILALLHSIGWRKCPLPPLAHSW